MSSFLPTCPSGNPYTLSFPFVDPNGNAFVGSAVASMSLAALDMLDNFIMPPTALGAPASNATVMVATVPGVYNTLGQPYPNIDEGVIEGNLIVPTEDAREAQLTVTLTTGAVFVLKQIYRVAISDNRLILLQNSFQTYNHACLTANGMPNLKSFPAASEGDRSVALAEAWFRLTRLGYFVRWPRDPDAQNYLNWFDSRNEIIIPRLWTLMTSERWYTFYPEVFRDAMRRAQVAEAEIILTNDVYQQRRQSGVVSETIGKSSVTLRRTKSISEALGISKEALFYVTGYVDIKYTLARS